MPFLEEEEWRRIEPILRNGKKPIQDHRKKFGSTIEEARAAVRTEPMDIFLEITGVDEIHFDVIHHHRLSDWGPQCTDCGHLLRTSTANFCANCGKRGDVQYPRD